jgi:hypothetical protein
VAGSGIRGNVGFQLFDLRSKDEGLRIGHGFDGGQDFCFERGVLQL